MKTHYSIRYKPKAVSRTKALPPVLCIDHHFTHMLSFLMKILIFTSIITLFLSALFAESQADIYKYIDGRGVVHFTNVSKGKGYKRVISEKKSPSNKAYDHIIKRKSSEYNIDPAIIKALITTESSWNPRAVSKKGAMGLMQLMPATANEMQITDPFDPEENIDGGTRYLRQLLDRFDDNLDLALAAYNAGPSRVEKRRGIPRIAETKKFIKKVLSIYEGKSGEKTMRIYKIVFDNGTVLYTNSPRFAEGRKLSNF